MRINFTNFDEIRISSKTLRPLWAFSVRKRMFIAHVSKFRHIYSAFSILMMMTLIIGGFTLLLGNGRNSASSTTAQVDPSPQTTPMTIAIGGNELASWNIYYNDTYKVSFQYPPEFFEACCFTDGPFSEIADVKASFATRLATKPEEMHSFDSVTLYIIPNTQNIPFNEFVKTQKEVLTKYAKVNTNGTPYRTEQTVMVDGKTGYLLKGYLWDGDVALLPSPTNNIFIVLVRKYNNVTNQDIRFYTTLSTVSVK